MAKALRSIPHSSLIYQLPPPHEIFLKKVFKRAQHLAPSGVLLSRGQDVAFVMKLAGVTQMALLKSKAAKAAAATDAARLLSANPVDAQAAQGSAADWSIAQLSAIYTEHRTQLVSQARRITKNEAEANEIVQEAFLKFMLAAPDLDTADRAIAYLRTTSPTSRSM